MICNKCNDEKSLINCKELSYVAMWNCGKLIDRKTCSRQRSIKYLDIREDENITNDSTSVEINSGIWWRHLVAGGIAGVVSRTCTAPLDRLKVFLQVHSNGSIIKCFQGMLKEGGVIGLWRGNGINVLKIAPESAVKFMIYEQAKRAIKNYSNRDLSIYERFMAGSLAGGVSQTAIYPLETLRTRLALRKTGEYSGIFDAAKKMYRREGLRSYYRGYVPNILGIIPYAGIDLAIYETLKNNYIHRNLNAENPGALLLIGCGIASSTCGQIVCYPLALVRTRLQAQAILTSPEHAKSMTMTGVIRNIIAREGFIGLYHGFTPNLMKVFPAVSISYVVYERMQQTLGVKMT